MSLCYCLVVSLFVLGCFSVHACSGVQCGPAPLCSVANMLGFASWQWVCLIRAQRCENALSSMHISSDCEIKGTTPSLCIVFFCHCVLVQVTQARKEKSDQFSHRSLSCVK